MRGVTNHGAEPHLGLLVTNSGSETLSFGAYGPGFRADALPLVLAPGVTWVEGSFWGLLLQYSDALRDAVANGAVRVGEGTERPIATRWSQYDLQWPIAFREGPQE
jgi:hypothetical protein